MAQLQAPAPTTPTIREADHVAVYTRATWSAAWTLQRYLYPTGRAILRAAPGFSRIELAYDFGDVKREDQAGFLDELSLELRGQYVQVRRLGGSGGDLNLFTGVICDEELEVEGETEIGNSSGRQVLRAYGMEYPLARASVRGAYCLQGTGIAHIDRDLTFNLRHARGGSLLGNRTSGKHDDAYAFGADGEVWTCRDIAEYLLARFGPDDVTYELAGQADLLDRYKVVVRLGAGQDVYSALCALIDRRRGLGFWIDPDHDPDSGTVGVVVYSLVGDPVTVGDQTVAANANQRVFDMDERIDMRVRLSRSQSTRYDRIVVRGAPIRTCFTVGYDDGTLEEAWSVQEEDDYKDGSHRAGADAAEHDAERKTDRFERVYQAHRIARDWDWRAGNGHELAAAVNIVNPAVDSEGTLDPDTQGAYYNHARALLNWLPLPCPADASDAEPEFRRPLVLVKDQGGVWRQVDGIPASDGSTLKCQVRMATREMMFYCVPPGGNHVFAKDHWSGASATDLELSEEIDYKTMIATLAMETDQVLQVEVVLRDGPRTLTIEVPDAQAWYVTPRTVVAVEDGELVEFDPGDFGCSSNVVRDDSDRLRAVAAFAAAWYGEERATAVIEMAGLRRDLRLGYYLREGTRAWESETIGTVVTSITYDFGDRPSTTYRTSYSEIDAEALAAGARLMDERNRAQQLRETAKLLDELTTELSHLTVRIPRLPFDRSLALWIPLQGAGVANWSGGSGYGVYRLADDYSNIYREAEWFYNLDRVIGPGRTGLLSFGNQSLDGIGWHYLNWDGSSPGDIASRCELRIYAIDALVDLDALGWSSRPLGTLAATIQFYAARNGCYYSWVSYGPTMCDVIAELTCPWSDRPVKAVRLALSEPTREGNCLIAEFGAPYYDDPRVHQADLLL